MSRVSPLDARVTRHEDHARTRILVLGLLTVTNASLAVNISLARSRSVLRLHSCSISVRPGPVEVIPCVSEAAMLRFAQDIQDDPL